MFVRVNAIMTKQEQLVVPFVLIIIMRMQNASQHTLAGNAKENFNSTNQIRNHNSLIKFMLDTYRQVCYTYKHE